MLDKVNMKNIICIVGVYLVIVIGFGFVIG